ncbi:gamma-glutamyltransferase [Biostraticola tofi]|uniref:Glutathione hydrolase proenzyme n=1 Tax=Biostraticola tofi TaxID=466109 RepID=A0A4V2W4F4_9GAMM|nr:gamma-glutamyltransferase [Biostraticola tofi]TCV95639.1 gamma-glutamyltransferase 1 [Biostraticola tofi]
MPVISPAQHLLAQLLLLSSIFLSPMANAAVAPPLTYGADMDIHHPVTARHGMVSSVDETATRTGLDILRQGGNAVDAAVAVGYALAVTHPQAGNLGGGGFMLLRTHRGDTVAIDFRETAPARATRDMFIGADGNADSKRSLISPLASGTPGTVAGLSLARDRYGSMPLDKLIQPAIRLAKEGIVVNKALAGDLASYGREALINHANSKAVFFKADGEPYTEGERLRQPALAKSLELIAAQGPAAFYRGSIATQIAGEMKKQGGLISLDDLKNYSAKLRQPVSGSYRGYQIFSMPPPSSGGIHIIEILNILENFTLSDMGAGSADAIHVMSEAMKFAYADRAEYLGDPDFVKVPGTALTSKAYAKTLAERIDIQRANPSATIKPGQLQPYESAETTHFSVVDKEGNAVAVTYTLNTNFGSGIMAGSSGILLNNEMDDFAAKPGAANIFGLTGGDANAVQANKRPLSSMSPTIIVRDGKVWLVTGTPGGSRIITSVLQLIVNMIDFKMNVAEATEAPRFHQQWTPDELRVEQGFSPDTLKLLAQKGQYVAVKPVMGSLQSIAVMPDGSLAGASDPRVTHALTAGY